MKQNVLFPIWGVLFIICAALGFIPDPTGAARFLLTLLSMAFFVPPALLIYGAVKQHDTHTLRLVRNFSALSLGVTLVLLILNVLSAVHSETLGNILYYVLIIVSSPMICSGYWVLSLFLWACLLIVCLKYLRKG